MEIAKEYWGFFEDPGLAEPELMFKDDRLKKNIR